MDAGIAEQLDTIASSISVRRPLVSPPDPFTPFGAAIKRCEDVIFGSLLIFGISPVLVAIALAIKLTSRGPVFFLQDRRGRDGTTFRCFKFRTMYIHHTDHDCREQTRQGDPRVTRIGRWLRRHSLDELPQLFNVIMGHMSLVGPRPHAHGTNIDGILLHEAHADYLARYQVRPGITGWAQVNGYRGIIDSPEVLAKRVEYDLHYIANWSFWLDIRILLRTVTCVFNNERAF